MFYERDFESVQRLERKTGNTIEVYRSSNESGGRETNLNSAPSPDGRHLAVVDGQSIVVMEVESGQRKNSLQLATAERCLFPGSLAWTRDGRFLIFGKMAGEYGELWRVSSSDGVAEPAGLRVHNRYIYFLRMSPNGRKLAFSVGDDPLPRREIWSVENY